MNYILAAYLLTNGILAAYLGIRQFFHKTIQYIETRLLVIACLSSAVWSIGFGMLQIQTNPQIAYYCRSFGMFGVFTYLAACLAIVSHISGIDSLFLRIINMLSLTGIPLCILVVQPSQATYYMRNGQMTYSFTPGLINNAYTIYCIFVGVCAFIVTLIMLNNKQSKRIHTYGVRFFFVVVTMIFGMVLDTVFPLVGLSAIPGSSLLQALATWMIYYGVKAINKTRIDIHNMSTFIYYSLSVPVLVYDAKYKLHITNDAAQHFMSLPPDSKRQDNYPIESLFLIDPEKIFDFEGNHQEVEALCQYSSSYCSLSISKIHDSFDDIIGYIITVNDLSERILTMKKLKEAKQEAETANQIKSSFLANMSHEIRTPMNAIMGLSELLLTFDLPKEAQDYVADIKNSSVNLLGIVNDILDISKLESGKAELVIADYSTANLLLDIRTVINTAANKKGLNFTYRVDDDMPRKLRGDAVRIRSILINLLNNAVKYTRLGNISLDVKIIRRDENRIKLCFTIKDTGIGIREQDLAKIFEAFAQVDKRVHGEIEGTGLGLSIVKGNVALMGGTISVESTYGVGSTFTVTFEQEIADNGKMVLSEHAEIPTDDAFHMSGKRFRAADVLIVDDSKINLKVAANTLQHYGLNVAVSPDGPTAVNLCKTHEYELIFMDQMMPGMDGIEAMHQIRSLNSYYGDKENCKIVVLTANAITGAREALLAEGFDEYLEKPMNFAKLEALLAQFIQ